MGWDGKEERGGGGIKRRIKHRWELGRKIKLMSKTMSMEWGMKIRNEDWEWAQGVKNENGEWGMKMRNKN